MSFPLLLVLYNSDEAVAIIDDGFELLLDSDFLGAAFFFFFGGSDFDFLFLALEAFLLVVAVSEALRFLVAAFFLSGFGGAGSSSSNSNSSSDSSL